MMFYYVEINGKYIQMESDQLQPLLANSSRRLCNEFCDLKCENLNG